jgi:uncharacterized protein (TIGR00725 family)
VSTIRYIAVVGGTDVDEAVTSHAEEVGRLLARAGAVVVTGGRQGVSAAVSRGAVEAGGITLGILPGRSREEGNHWLSYSVVTDLGDTRNAIVVMNGDAVIALDGAYGTLNEIARALIDGVPVVGLGTWELRRHAVDDEAVVRVSTPEEAVETALRLAAG